MPLCLHAHKQLLNIFIKVKFSEGIHMAGGLTLTLYLSESVNTVKMHCVTDKCPGFLLEEMYRSFIYNKLYKCKYRLNYFMYSAVGHNSL